MYRTSHTLRVLVLSLFLSAVVLVLFLSVHSLAQAQTTGASKPGFVPLAGIPFLQGGQTMGGMLNALYKLSIIVGALLAVVMIAWGGFQYMSPTVGGKEKGMSTIRSAIFGLLILLTTALILKTIFGDVKLDVLNLSPINANPQQQQPSGATTPANGGGTATTPPSTPPPSAGTTQSCSRFGRVCPANWTRGGTTGPLGLGCTCTAP